MTLTDLLELRGQALLCGDVKSLIELLDDYGEDCDPESASAIFSHLKETGGREFDGQDGQTIFSGRTVSCPDCHNSNPDKLLSSSSEVLSGQCPAHFGCCECGTQFEI